MANLTKDTDWTGQVEQTKKQKAYTFSTKEKFLDKDIKMTINVPGVNLQNSETFYINDGVYTWNWSIDSNGNVTIT